jgi:CubicO group peptidase (beta-lactamase class C family)
MALDQSSLKGLRRSRAFGISLALCLLGVTGCTSAPRTVQKPHAYDSVFEEVMARYRLPGLALGVVHEGQVVYMRTAGETVAGTGQPITPRTLFKIASNGKAMTTGVLARLVDAGKLHWDDPVIRHLPGFRMHDPWVTREMQVRDLLIHNSGLRSGAGDLMLWPEPNLFTRADIMAGLAYLKPVHSFRSRYDYDNLLYIVAGEVAAAAAGASYEELIRRELFAPLGMERCQVGEWRRDEVGDVAQPHMRTGERNVVIRADQELIPVSTAAAAGGIRCSLDDLLRWVRMWLDPELKPVDAAEPWLSRAQGDALWTAHMPMPLSRRQRTWENSRFYAYGYGWRLSDVDGVLKVAHTGTLTGMYSAVTLLPEKNAGFVSLINGNGADARAVLNQILVKAFTAPGTAASVATYAEEISRQRQRRRALPAAAPDVLARRPAAPAALASWLGLYRDPWFGEVSVCARGERVRFSAVKSPQLSGDVMHVRERLLVDWDDASVDAEPWLTFTAGVAGEPAMLTLAKVDPDADFSYDYEDLHFTRIGDCY